MSSAPSPPPVPSPAARFVPWIAAGLVVLALATGAISGAGSVVEHPWLFVALLVSMLILDAIRIDLFERLQTSPASLPVLVLAAVFGPVGVIAGEALIAAQRALRRNPPVRYLYDFGTLSLAGIAAAAVFWLLPRDGADLVAVGALAGLAYYAVNMPLLALAIGLSRGTSPIANFREQLAWLLPHYLAFGGLAGVFVLAEERLHVTAFVLFGVPTAVLWVAEKQYLTRSRASVEELRRSHAELQSANARLLDLLGSNRSLLERLQQSYLSTITSLARTIEAKDPYTGGHTERVARVTGALARELGYEGDDLRAIGVGAVIHDIGKIGVSDKTLLKPGPLDPDERAEIERHPEISTYILGELDFPPIVKQMVRSHHERWDGGGYPDGLAGEEIPLPARILTVADALDAMTSDRPYRAAMPITKALAIIEAGSGMQFCPRVVAALRRCVSRGPETLVASPPARRPPPWPPAGTPGALTG